jgi:hypothetical protein
VRLFLLPAICHRKNRRIPLIQRPLQQFCQ